MTRIPTHPGKVFLEDVMKPLNLTVTDAAGKIMKTIPRSLQGHRCYYHGM